MVIMPACLVGQRSSILLRVAKFVAEYGSGHPLGLISQESQVRILPLQPVLFQCSTAVVQVTVNHLVVGSIPATGANLWGYGNDGELRQTVNLFPLDE